MFKRRQKKKKKRRTQERINMSKEDAKRKK